MVHLLQVFLFVLCVLAAALFSSAETALMSLSLSAWERLRGEKPSLSSAYTLWSENPSLVLATLLFGNTLSCLGASVLASAFFRDWGAVWMLSSGFSLMFVSLTAGGTLLVAGEIIPKLYARHWSEQVVAGTAPWLARLTRILQPFLSGLTVLADGVKRAISQRPSEPLITPNELRQALSEARSDALGPSTRRILSNLMAFDRIRVADVMVPRAAVAAVRLEASQDRTLATLSRSGFSRIPVYSGHIDNILGIVYAKDLLVEWRSSGLVILEDLLRPPYRITPEAPLSVLLQGFRQGHHLAVVTDSRGRTQGVVTIEDVVEAIVGDIADEFDQPSS